MYLIYFHSFSNEIFINAFSIELCLPVFHIYWIFIEFILLAFIILLSLYSIIFCWICIYSFKIWSSELLIIWLCLCHLPVCPLFLLWVFQGGLGLVNSFEASFWRSFSPYFCNYMIIELLICISMTEDLILSPLDYDLSYDHRLQFCIWLFIIQHNYFLILNQWLSLLLKKLLCLQRASASILFEI